MSHHSPELLNAPSVLQAVKELLLSWKDNAQPDLLHRACRLGADLSQPISEDGCPLHVAARQGSIEVRVPVVQWAISVQRTAALSAAAAKGTGDPHIWVDLGTGKPSSAQHDSTARDCEELHCINMHMHKLPWSVAPPHAMEPCASALGRGRQSMQHFRSLLMYR